MAWTRQMLCKNWANFAKSKQVIENKRKIYRTFVERAAAAVAAHGKKF